LELAEIAGARVTGVDRSQKFIDYARTNYRHPNLRFLIGEYLARIYEEVKGRPRYIVTESVESEQ
jgi:hypothetical protein